MKNGNAKAKSEPTNRDAAVLRPAAEELYAEELEVLAKADKDPRPPGWKLSPRAVRNFICGSEKPKVSRKFYGDDTLVERAAIGLASNRGLLLVGEPGTAKSMLSELLSAAISGTSTNVIQGSAGTTEDSIKYSWNYALLLAEGPSSQAARRLAALCRYSRRGFGPIRGDQRCPPEIQDSLRQRPLGKSHDGAGARRRRPRAPCPPGVQRDRHGQHPRPGRQRDVQRAQAAFQF